MKYIAVLCLSIFFSACMNSPELSTAKDALTPTMQISDTKISSITLEEIFLDTSIDIKNPYPIDIPIKGATINIYYQDKITSSYKIEGENTLKSLSQSNLSLKSSIKILDLIKLIRDYRELELIDLKIEAIIAIPLPQVLGDSIQLKERFEMKIPTISPSISLKDITYNIPNLRFILNLKNRGKAPLMLDDVKYSMQLSGVDFDGIAKSVQNSDGSVNLHIDIAPKLDNFNIDLAKKTNINIQSALQIGEIPYKIPINVNLNR